MTGVLALLSWMRCLQGELVQLVGVVSPHLSLNSVNSASAFQAVIMTGFSERGCRGEEIEKYLYRFILINGRSAREEPALRHPQRWADGQQQHCFFFFLLSSHFIHLPPPPPPPFSSSLSVSGCVLPYCVRKEGGSRILAHGDSSSACDLQTRALLLLFSSTANLPNREALCKENQAAGKTLMPDSEKYVEFLVILWAAMAQWLCCLLVPWGENGYFWSNMLVFHCISMYQHQPSKSHKSLHIHLNIKEKPND